MAPPPATGPSSIPLAYRAFFLYIEPIATAVGAYYAHFDQTHYLQWTYSPAHAPVLTVPTVSSIVLTQLANLYFVFALNEALVLRATSDRKVWRAFLFGLLVADFGHLWSVHVAGTEVYWRVWEWNAMYWGNVGFVYVGACMRMAFLAGVGLGGGAVGGRGKVKARR